MLRIIVADDERPIVDWVTDILTTAFPDFEILTAYSGKDVLTAFSDRIIDIAVLDIHMPGINGIELAAELIKSHPNLQVILFTGFDEFDLIYRVNGIRNIRYLLKTETDGQIIRCVGEVADKIQGDRKRRQELQDGVRAKLLLEHFEQRGFLLDLFYEAENPAAMSSKLTAYGKRLRLDPTRDVGITLIRLEDESSRRPSVQTDVLLSLYTCFSENLQAYFDFSIVDISSTSIFLLTQAAKQSEEKRSSAYLKKELDRVLLMFQNLHQCDIRFLTLSEDAAWSRVSQTMDALLQYDEVIRREASSSGIFGVLLDAHQLTKAIRNQAQSLEMQQLIRQLSGALISADTDLFSDTLQKMAELVPVVRMLPQSCQASLRGQLALFFLDCINQCPYQDELQRHISLKPLYHSLSVQEWTPFLQYIQSLGTILLELSIRNGNHNRQRLVQSIQTYITENLAADLTVSKLSEVFNYNQTYISRIFKQTLGIPLSQFIKTARLNKAKELLLNTDLSVQNIASMVGFDTAQYFTMVFRKEVGLTPNVFRHTRLLP